MDKILYMCESNLLYIGIPNFIYSGGAGDVEQEGGRLS